MGNIVLVEAITVSEGRGEQIKPLASPPATAGGGPQLESTVDNGVDQAVGHAKEEDGGLEVFAELKTEKNVIHKIHTYT